MTSCAALARSNGTMDPVAADRVVSEWIPTAIL